MRDGEVAPFPSVAVLKELCLLRYTDDFLIGPIRHKSFIEYNDGRGRAGGMMVVLFINSGYISDINLHNFVYVINHINLRN